MREEKLDYKFPEWLGSFIFVSLLIFGVSVVIDSHGMG
jgi:hypothetical protein